MRSNGFQQLAQVEGLFKPVKVKGQHTPATPKKNLDKAFLLQSKKRLSHGRA